MCCHPITTGQIYERTVQKGIMQRIPMISCLTIALVIFILEMFETTTQYVYSETHYSGER